MTLQTGVAGVEGGVGYHNIPAFSSKSAGIIRIKALIALVGGLSLSVG